jgi:hypothetical protein
VGTPITFTITVGGVQNVSTIANPVRMCLTDTVLTLAASPAGGVWSGPGVITGTNKFDPAAAGVGVKLLTYTLNTGCGGVATLNMTVNDCKERHNIFAGAIRLWPNPTNGRFNIEFLTDLYKAFTMDVIDADGHIVYINNFANMVYGRLVPMNLPGLSAGVYFIRIYNESDHATFRLDVIH